MVFHEAARINGDMFLMERSPEMLRLHPLSVLRVFNKSKSVPDDHSRALLRGLCRLSDGSAHLSHAAAASTSDDLVLLTAV